MIAELQAIKEELSSIRSRLASGAAIDSLHRVDRVMNIVVESEGKIWLRTKVGKPMLVDLQAAVDKAYRAMGDGVDEGFEAALREVEEKAGRIDAESQRRGMVVT